MAGIYIHIPFCKKACHYCNFHFSTSTHNTDSFILALENEIELQKDYLKDIISTIYIGGGTPSILPSAKVGSILDKIKQTFKVDTNAEITLEANPDDISQEKLNEWKKSGINRLSIGVQSFYEVDLQWMNRAHNAKQAETCIRLAQSEGFNNLTIDLIYGTPTLTDENWQQNVSKAIALGVNHLSCYALTVEPKTALEKMIREKQVVQIDTEKQAHHFELLMAWMQSAGFEHYEISNFAKPGYRSKHNSSYWQGKHYLGLGPSAHSFNGETRQWNVANNALYIKSIEKYKVPFQIEILTKDQKLNEYIMTALRTLEGVSLLKIELEFGKEILNKVLLEAKQYLSNKQLEESDNFLKTTNSGKLLADGIAANLFV